MEKLSSQQCEVIKLMQEGWELGVDTEGWRSTLGQRRARLQKYGLGKGDPIAYFKAVVIDALERKKVIEQEPNNYPMIKSTKYHLTEKGKAISV